MKHSLLQPFRITHRYFWGTLIVFVVLGALYVYVFSLIKKVGHHVAVLAVETTTLETQESQIGQLRAHAKTADENLQELSLHFVDVSDPVDFLNMIESYGVITAVTTKFDTVSVDKEPNRLTLSLTASGSFVNVYRFISLIESAPYEISFSDMNMQSILAVDDGTLPKKPSTNVWETRITLSVRTVIAGTQ